MQSLRTQEDKAEALKVRMDQQRKLGATIDALIRDADGDASVGCGICSLWRRLGRRGRAATAVALAEQRANGGSGASVNTQQTSSRLFGVRKADPHVALAAAAETMESRNHQLEARAASEREEARRLMALGQKASAMRALKRAKGTEKQLEANQAALMALEQQVDMMTQAAMQKQVATALATSSKGMKAQKALLKTAESAVDDAQDARDMADDLGNVMADFAQSGNGAIDDDELMDELNQMINEAPPPRASLSAGSEEGEMSSAEAAVAAEAARQAEIANLQSRLARYDEAVAVREALPKAPETATSRNREEKAALLANAAVSAA
jgi:type II secretory pathway pseudopilin PulG